jgi:hypothetical protein
LQREGYDMNVWTAKKDAEKLIYMHNNPVKRGLVKEPGAWAWPSWRFNFRNDALVFAMDTLPRRIAVVPQPRPSRTRRRPCQGSEASPLMLRRASPSTLPE